MLTQHRFCLLKSLFLPSLSLLNMRGMCSLALFILSRNSILLSNNNFVKLWKSTCGHLKSRSGHGRFRYWLTEHQNQSSGDGKVTHLLVCPPLCSRLKYLDKYWMDFEVIWCHLPISGVLTFWDRWQKCQICLFPCTCALIFVHEEDIHSNIAMTLRLHNAEQKFLTQALHILSISRVSGKKTGCEPPSGCIKSKISCWPPFPFKPSIKNQC